ncbi:MAG: PAS domain S-box protein [Haloarculaceae archaeon]
MRELERYEGILEASGDPVYTLDADGRFTFVNDALVDMVGHDEATLLGSHVSAVIPPADVARIEGTIRSLLSSDRSRETAELTVVTDDGERIPSEAHVALLPFAETFRGTVGVVRDVSGWTEHVRKLEGFQQRTRALMHTPTAAETAQVAIDTAKEVLGVSLAGFNLLDEDGDSLVPVATLDEVRETFDGPPAYDRDSVAETDRIVWGAFEAGDPRVIEDTREHGRLAEETPARSAVLHPLGDHGIFIVSSTEVGAFAGVVSHDLRNPLNVATGSLDLAREECDAAELDAVADAHDRMEGLIDDLLAIARDGDDTREVGPLALDEAV